MEQRIRDGKWIEQPRTGYIKVAKEDGKTEHDIDPKIAPLIKKLFELYATEKYSVKSIIEPTYKLGFRNKEVKGLHTA